VDKSVLLDYAVEEESDCRVAQADGACLRRFAPIPVSPLRCVECLSVPQRDAVRDRFGISASPAPDRFLVSLAVLNLISNTTGHSADAS
jgi:hypothetical protein